MRWNILLFSVGRVRNNRLVHQTRSKLYLFLQYLHMAITRQLKFKKYYYYRQETIVRVRQLKKKNLVKVGEILLDLGILGWFRLTWALLHFNKFPVPEATCRQQHLDFNAVLLLDWAPRKAWLTVAVPVHPKAVGPCVGQSTSHQENYFCNWLCARGTLCLSLSHFNMTKVTSTFSIACCSITFPLMQCPYTFAI